MWEDPVVKETRNLRQQYLEKFDGDFETIFADIRKRQEESSRKKVSFPPKRPKAKTVTQSSMKQMLRAA